MEEKACDPEQLSYNPERLRTLVTAILRGTKLMRETLADMSPSEMKENYKETDVRHLLMSQLWITGAGHRPSAFTHMRVGELQGATPTTDNDIMLVDVKHHKTVEVHGPAKVPFILPGLYKACIAYVKAWRDETKPDDLVFAKRGSGDPAEFDLCITWLVRTLDVLRTSFSIGELTSLSGGTLRKGWDNWARNSPDEFVKQIANRVMCHSERVSNIFYREPTRNEVGVFAGNVLHSMGLVENIDSDTNNPSHSDEDGENVSTSPPPCPSAPPTPQHATTHREGDTDSVEEGENVLPPPPTLPSPPQPATSHREGATAKPRGFSESEHELICSVFSKDGQLPKSITSQEVTVAYRDCPEFKHFYDNLVIAHGKKWAATRALSDAIRYKNTKTQKKTQKYKNQKQTKN